MKISKKILSMIMALLLVVSILPKSSYAEETCTCNVHCTAELIKETSCAFCRASGNPDDCKGTDTLEGGEFTYQGIVYKITDKYNHDVSVKDGKSVTGNVTIPSKAFNGDVSYTVTEIDPGAFMNCTGLISVTIPGSVTEIWTSAFGGCTNLTSVTIGGSVATIYQEAFAGCTSLTSITIPGSVTSIGNSAFQGCTSLTSITIPSGVSSIGHSAFSGCTSLTSITIPNGVASIGNSTFQGCTSLTSITIPSSVTGVGMNAFRDCTGLTSITIPSGVASIGNSTFQGCTSLTSITIPSGVASIGNSTFQGCTSLTSITIPNGVASIGNSTFQGCTSLTSITIPNSVTSIGLNAFQSCTSLTSIAIPDSVTSIGNAAFTGCTGLTSITIPSSVAEIGNNAFRGCTSLQTVLLMTDSPKKIADSAFYETSATITHQYVAPSDLRWEGTTLRWDGLGINYVRYEVKINPISADSGIRPIAKTVYTTDHFYDFSGYISPGTYTVSVTAVLPEMQDNSQPKYESSETVTLEEQRVPPRIEISNIYPVRAGVDSANISFVASMPGTMYYFVTDLIQQNPSIDTSGEGMAIKEGYNLFHPTLNAAIDPTQWQYVYVTFKTAGGVLSEITRIDVVGTSRTTHRLTVTADEGGNIDPGSRYVEDGGSITFTITPDSGYKLDTLTLDGADVTSAVVGNQYTLTNVTAAHTVQVSFTPVSCICDTKCTDTANAGCPVCSANGAVLSEVCKGQETQATTYSVTVSKDGSGTITGEGSYAPGEQVTITASPDTANGYCTAGWGLSAVGGGVISPIERKTSHTFTMPEKDVAIAITFVPHSYISHTNNGNGTHDVHCIYCGDIQTASESCVDAHGGGGDATPDGWCDKCDAAMIYTITVQADGNGTAYTSLATAVAGTQITLTATPNTGYHFKEWQVVSGSVTITNNQFNMPIGDVTVKAVFEQDAPSTYTVTVQNDGNGTASASPATAAAGTQIVLTSTANSGYHFKEWQVVFGNVSIVNNAFQMPSENVTIKAIFEQDAPTTYTITFNFNDGTAQTTTAHTGTDGTPLRNMHVFSAHFTNRTHVNTSIRFFNLLLST